MAKFDDSKVINSLRTDKAEVGRLYYCGDTLLTLKYIVENEVDGWLGELTEIHKSKFPFKVNGGGFQFLYPYEEEPNKRMTNRQLSEWLAKGNGERSSNDCRKNSLTFEYDEFGENEEVSSDIIIRPWGSDEWVEPTVDIYKRDCKGE